ncbi:lytic transglycosylase domain-containing protein [Lysobacter sp. N42]|uniref:lytic transglycosylase domain-containing protein n=1 Tax=Lysobacter sp. N42 TaxID=2545719 RepID=UPI0026BFD61A
MLRSLLLLVPLLAMPAWPAHARTVYRCVQGGTVSLATAPEPGSRCEARHVPDDAVKLPNLWGALGLVKGTLYEREQDGRIVYSTRNLPGSRKVLSFTVQTPPGEPAHEGLGRVGPARVDRFAPQFRAAAKKTGVDDAYLRAIAHAESGFDPQAVSPKGARGVMQLMPGTARELGVTDPHSPVQSIDGGARHLRQLIRRYRGDLVLAAAAYNAGAGVVARYGGVPPYRETRAYVEKVRALYTRYRRALGLSPRALDGHVPLTAAK